MEALVRRIAPRLEGAPVRVALCLPGGGRVGASNADVVLQFSDWSCVATLAAGQIGKVAEEIVEGGVSFEGAMRDLMAAAAYLLPGTPVPSDTSWWTQVVRRARSLVVHTPQRDAQPQLACASACVACRSGL